MHSLTPYDPGFCQERLLNESVVLLDMLILELEVFNAHRIDRGTKSSSMAEPYSVSPSAVLKKGTPKYANWKFRQQGRSEFHRGGFKSRTGRKLIARLSGSWTNTLACALIASSRARIEPSHSFKTRNEVRLAVFNRDMRPF